MEKLKILLEPKKYVFIATLCICLPKFQESSGPISPPNPTPIYGVGRLVWGRCFRYILGEVVSSLNVYNLQGREDLKKWKN
jgi:hypothetical protein